MLFLISSNPVITRPNAKEVYRALEKVEFMAVADFFMTPTAELADIVLPASTWLEMDYVGDFWKRHGYILPRRKVIQVGECRSDHEMLNDLGHRIGQGQYWWDDFEQALDYILHPMGITWNDFKKMNYIRGEVNYYKYKEKGFSTPTRKFELSSTVLEKLGYDPLPQHREPPESPVSTPDVYNEYPYILITGVRPPGFFHTENRQIPWLRELHRDPIVEIHPDAAAKEGIQDGDWVVIESRRGKVRQRAKLALGRDPRIVSAQHAWWFPEKKDPGHGWDESNVNILTEDALEGMDPAMGASNLKTALCRIYPENRQGGLVMNHYKLIFEEYACWGCKACEVACKQEYNPPPYGAYDPKGADAVKYVSVWGDGPKVVDGKLDFMWRVNVCKHCVEPPCAVSCPEGAITKDPKTGIVLHDKEKCNGCNADTGQVRG